MNQNTDFSDKIALVTGASRGIGRAVALALGRGGAHVIALARTQSALEELDDEIKAAGGTATLMVMDLEKLEEVDKLGPAIAQRFGRLDIFIGNAAILGTLTPLTHADSKMWQKVMDINLTANFRLLRTLDPLLKKADSGRIVFTTSGLAREVLPYWGPYSTSKAALEMLCKVYAAENEKTAIRANMVDPGIVDTAMLGEAFPGGYEGAMKKPDDVVPAFLNLCAPSCKKNGEVVKA